MIDEKEYQKMKDNASEFCRFLINSEIEFKQEITDHNEKLACYIDFKLNNGKKISAVFVSSGGVYFADYNELNGTQSD